MFPIRDHNPSTQTPFVSYTIMAANFLIFIALFPISGDDASLSRIYWDWALIPARVTDGSGYLGIFTSMFLHGGFAHIAGNMLFLWIFGDNLEEKLGHVGFALFYVATGIAAAALQYAADPVSDIPMLGASGAIAGVMGGYLLFFPKARVDILLIFVVFFRIFPIPAWIMLVLWFGMQIFGGLGAQSGGGGVAYWAHAGGFVAGIALCLPPWLRSGGTAFWQATYGHPDHPKAQYPFQKTNIPPVQRR